MLSWLLTFEGEHALHDQAVRAQQSLAHVPVLDPVPPQWLHLTLATGGSRSDLTDDCVRQLINAAHLHIAGLHALPLAFGRLVVFAESVVLIPEPSADLSRLRDELVASVRDVRGEHAPATVSAFVPHVSIAYANGSADTNDVTTALAAAKAVPLTGIHPTLSLVEMHRDDRQYQWRAISSFPL